MQKLKTWLRAWLFYDLEQSLRAGIEKEVTVRTKQATREYRQQLNIVDCVREQLKGINPRKTLSGLNPTGLRDATDILDEYKGDEEYIFLKEVKQLQESGALRSIITYLVREQLLFTSLDAEEMKDVNFGRATINGFSLLLEEIERLAGIDAERSAKEEPFDVHEAV